MAPKKVLIVGPSWVGDMVMAQSLFKTIKEDAPDALIDVLAPDWTHGLLARMPEVERGITMPLSHGQFGLSQRINLGKALQANGYSQAIVLPNSWKSALVPYFAKIPLRTGYIGECRWGLLNDARKLNQRQLTMTVQRFVALGLPKPSPSPPTCPRPQFLINPEQRQEAIDKFGLTTDTINQEKILALCPGAEYGEAKRWPAGHFAALAQKKIQDGWQVWLFGSTKDRAIADQINQTTASQCHNFAGKTTLAEAIDLLSLCHAVVSNDSGLMHVAAALDKHLIALYGSSDANFTPPLSGKARILSLNLVCSPCFKRTCPLGHTDCLQGIKPEHVLESLPP